MPYGVVYVYAFSAELLAVKSMVFLPFRPGLITALDSYRITQVACGDAHSVAIDDKGTIFTWGDNSFGQLGVDDGKGDKIENKFFPTYVMYDVVPNQFINYA